ncbi:MAG: type VI secretion system tube protein Hcp [Planctomycetia bacterium]|nr:type VI secretion system tube protein Hcp [Planctomycetia bacterium]
MACDNFLIFGPYTKGSTPAPDKVNTITGPLEVVGETQDKDFKNALEIKEFSFGVENPTTIGSMSAGAGAGRAKFNEFTVKKGVDIASPPLFLAAGLGCHFPTVSLVVRKAGGVKVPYLVYTFKMVFVTKVEWSGGGGEEAPDEDVTFVYGAMEIQYTQQDSTGAEKGTSKCQWSQVVNQSSLDVATK